MSSRPVSRVALLLTALLSLPWTTANSFAEVAPGFNLPRLVNNADLIVIGTIADIDEMAFPSSRERIVTGRIRVHQVLKGSVESDPIVFWSRVWVGVLEIGDLRPDLPAVFFMKHRDGTIEFAQPHYPIVRTVSAPAVRASDPLGAAIEAMTAVLVAPGATASMKRRAISNLWQTPGPETIAGLRPALEDPDRGIRLQALAALLSNNDLEALPLAETVLLPARALDRAEADLRLGVRHLTHPAAVPTLARLLARADVETKREAAAALGKIGTATALRALGRALDDQSDEVRFAASKGIATATGQYRLRADFEEFQAEELDRIKELKAILASLGAI